MKVQPSTRRIASGDLGEAASAYPLRELRALERKALWLSTWTIHNANHLRATG